MAGHRAGPDKLLSLAEGKALASQNQLAILLSTVDRREGGDGPEGGKLADRALPLETFEFGLALPVEVAPGAAAQDLIADIVLEFLEPAVELKARPGHGIRHQPQVIRFRRAGHRLRPAEGASDRLSIGAVPIHRPTAVRAMETSQFDGQRPALPGQVTRFTSASSCSVARCSDAVGALRLPAHPTGSLST